MAPTAVLDPFAAANATLFRENRENDGAFALGFRKDIYDRAYSEERETRQRHLIRELPPDKVALAAASTSRRTGSATEFPA